MTEQPPPGNYPPGNYPPPPGNYPPPRPGNYPPPPPPGNYPPPPPGNYPPPPGNYPPPPGNYPPPPGNYPPPPGNYPPPPPGNYPPPPAGNYPPPPGGGYPPAGGPSFGGAQTQGVGESFNWAWNAFRQNMAPLLIATVLYVVILGVLYGVVYGGSIALAPTTVSTYNSYDGSVDYSSSSSLGIASIAVLAVGGIVLLIVAAAVGSAYFAGVLDIANGQPVTVGSFLKPRNVVSVVIASLIVGVATSIGYVFCVIPGLVISIFTFFAIVALLDRNLSPIDAIKASVDIAKANFVPVLITWLIVGALVSIGFGFCFFPGLVAAPVASLYLVHTYRGLSGGQVPQPTQ
jgi:uncharacterized membrane protein